MFFSREVTHVVTMRQIPTDVVSTSSSYAQKSPNKLDNKTINPQLLDSRTSKFTFEANQTKKFSSSYVIPLLLLLLFSVNGQNNAN
jgi:hypothetical protein